MAEASRLPGDGDIWVIPRTFYPRDEGLHRAQDGYIRVDHGRYLADHIPSSHYVELPGTDRTIAAASDAVAEMRAFVTGTPDPVPIAERVLTTVLFTDLVGSTAVATEMGDVRWRERLERHDELVERQITRFNGRRIRSTGDGVLAVFDGPGIAIRCATALRDGVRGLGLEARLGIHTGEVEVRDKDIGGIAVHVAA